MLPDLHIVTSPTPIVPGLVRLRGNLSDNAETLCLQAFWRVDAHPVPPRPDGVCEHRDLAFALQSMIEETILHIVRALSKRHPSRNLYLTGGDLCHTRLSVTARHCADRATTLRASRALNLIATSCSSQAAPPADA